MTFAPEPRPFIERDLSYAVSLTTARLAEGGAEQAVNDLVADPGDMHKDYDRGLVIGGGL